MPRSILFLLIPIFVVLSSQVYADTRDFPVRVVSGRVSKLDWVGSKMLIRWCQSNGNYDEIAVKINKNTKIIKAGEPFSFAGIGISDSVNVRYYDDPNDFGPLMAAGITVISN